MVPVRIGALLLFATLVAASQNVPRSGMSPQPRPPVVDFDACGRPDPGIDSSKLVPFTLEADDRLYSSWQDNRILVRNLSRGTQVTRIGAVNIIREPDTGVITGEVDGSHRPLHRGDEVFGYGLHPDGFISFWGKGIWFTEYNDNVAVEGSCGFADKIQCRINITKPGVQEWWMQLKTSRGVTGWILGLKQSGDKFSYGPNAGNACRD